uniref:Uncharacterized protein n=1 Tax=Romanomermis culicivorax TaxID=13658 RepID=A0A915IBQ7_ROMCU
MRFIVPVVCLLELSPSSPCLLNATIRYRLSKTSLSEEFNHLIDNLYVDNLILEARDSQEAITKYHTLKTIFSDGSMNLREWSSNDEDFFEKDHINYQKYPHQRNERVTLSRPSQFIRLGYLSPLTGFMEALMDTVLPELTALGAYCFKTTYVKLKPSLKEETKTGNQSKSHLQINLQQSTKCTMDRTLDIEKRFELLLVEIDTAFIIPFATVKIPWSGIHDQFVNKWFTNWTNLLFWN